MSVFQKKQTNISQYSRKRFVTGSSLSIVLILVGIILLSSTVLVNAKRKTESRVAKSTPLPTISTKLVVATTSSPIITSPTVQTSSSPHVIKPKISPTQGAVKGASTSTLPSSPTSTTSVTSNIPSPTAASTSTNQPSETPTVVAANVTNVSSPSPSTQQTITVRLQVPGHEYQASIEPNPLVLTVMEQAKNQGLEYQTEDYSGLGKMITEINGQSQGGGKYWKYKINDVMAPKGISSQIVKDGDVIEWKLE